MKVKKFLGKNLNEILQKVKGEFGEDAVIVSVCKINSESASSGVADTSLVQVEATGQMHDVAGQKAKNSFEKRYEEKTTDGLNRKEAESAPTLLRRKKIAKLGPKDIDIDLDDDFSISNVHPSHLGLAAGQYEIFDRLHRSGTGEEIAKEIVIQASEGLSRTDLGQNEFVAAQVAEILPQIFEVSGPVQPRLPEDDGPAVVNFIGPTGVGKTTTIAKIAAQCTYKRRLKVGLITVDTFRIAAVEQPKVYSGLMRLPMMVARSVQEIDRALEKFRKADIVLVDTAGRSPNGDFHMAELEKYFGKGRTGKNYLVLAVNTHPKDIFKAAERFSCVPLESLVFTKLDESTQFGIILRAHLELGVPISYLTAGRKVPEDIEIANLNGLANLILPKSRMELPKGVII